MKKCLSFIVLMCIIFSFSSCGVEKELPITKDESFALKTKAVDNIEAEFTFADKKWKQSDSGGEWDLHCEYDDGLAYFAVFLYHDDGIEPIEAFNLQINNIMQSREEEQMLEDAKILEKNEITVTTKLYKAKREETENLYFFRLIQNDFDPAYYCFTLTTCLEEDRNKIEPQIEDIVFSMKLVDNTEV